MFIPHEGPGTWQSFLKRKDNVGLTIMEARQKYLKEQLLFENYLSTLNTVSTVSTAAAGAAGGPAPSTGGGGGGGGLDGWDIAFTIDTNYSYTGDWPSYYGDSTQTGFPSTTVNMINNTSTTGGGGTIFSATSGGEITVDWGDGTVETLSSYNFEFNWVNYNIYAKPGAFQHNYPSDGQYQIKVKGPGASGIKCVFMPLVSIDKISPTHNLRSMFSYTRKTPNDISLPNRIITNDYELVRLFNPEHQAQGPSAAFLSLPNNDWGVNITGLDTWDVSGYNNSTTARAFQTFAFNNHMSPDLSNWDTSGFKSISQMFKKGGNPASSGFWNWNLESLSDLAQLASVFESIAGEVTVPQLWDGWVFATSGITYYQSWFRDMLTGASVTNEDVLKNWIISIANDVNTPNDGILDGSGLATSLIVNGVTTDFPTLNLSADPNVSSAISTLTGKGWTITNL